MSQPFLPLEEKHTQRSSKLGRTALLWVLLVLMFLSFYELFSTPQQRHAPPSESHWWNLGVYLAAGGVLLVAWIAHLVRGTRRYHNENAQALSLLARGQLQEAAARFDSLALKYRRWRGLHLTAQHNLAWVTLRRGDLERAAERLAQTERAGLRKGSILLATCYTLLGDLTTAKIWLDEADKRRAKHQGDPRQADGQIAFARALYDCRRGAPLDAARSLDSRWRELDASLTGELMRPLRVARAYAVAQSAGPRETAQIEALLSPLRGGPSGEFAWLGARWPEMQAFLVTHSL